MTIWDFQDKLTRRLTQWALGNIVVGLALMWVGGPAVRGFGEMSAAWGAINLAIAFFGGLGTRKRRARPDAMDPAVLQKEQSKLSRVLWINTGLDVVYVAVGVWLAVARGPADPRMLGWGVAVIIQGGFLFFFDLIHARRLREPLPAGD